MISRLSDPIKQRLKNADSISQHRTGSTGSELLLAFLLAAAMVSLACHKYKLAYMTNDDYWIMTEAGGYFFSAPKKFHWYVNPIFSWGLSRLYAYLPGVNWYPVLHMAAIVLSLTLINLCLLVKASAWNLPTWATALVCAGMFAVLFCYPATTLSFTVSSAIVGSAAVALLFTFRFRGPCWPALLLLECGLMFGCYIWRPDTGKALLCFFLLALLYRLWADLRDCGSVKRSIAVKKAAGCFLLTCSLILGAVICAKSVYASPEYRDYVDFQQSRLLYMDYPHDSYQQKPQAYEAAGVSQELAALLEDWFFMDPAVTSDMFDILNQQTGHTSDFLASIQAEIEADSFSRFLRAYPGAEWILLVTAGIVLTACFLGALLLFIRPEQRLRLLHLLVFCALAAAGEVILLFYLFAKGRLPYRAFLVVAIPGAVSLLLLLADIFAAGGGESHEDSSRKASVLRGLTCALVLMFAITIPKGLDASYGSGKWTSRMREESFQLTEDIYAYALAHPENMYIHDGALVNMIDPNVYYLPGQGPSNLLFHGGCGMFSTGYYEQLHAMGFESLYTEDFLRENVYYMVGDMTSAEKLLAYLQTKYDGVQMTAEDCSAGKFTVVRYRLA